MGKLPIFLIMIILLSSMFMVQGANYPEPFCKYECPEGYTLLNSNIAIIGAVPDGITIRKNECGNQYSCKKNNYVSTTTDNVAASSISSNLDTNTATGATTITTDGDSYKFEKTPTKFYPGDVTATVISPSPNENITPRDSNETNNQCVNNSLIIDLIEKIFYLEKELDILKLELNKSQKRSEDSSINSSVEINQSKINNKRSRIVEFFAGIFN